MAGRAGLTMKEATTGEKATAAGGTGITAGGREASDGAEADPSEDQSSSNNHSHKVSGKSWRAGPFGVCG